MFFLCCNDLPVQINVPGVRFSSSLQYQAKGSRKHAEQLIKVDRDSFLANGCLFTHQTCTR